MDKTVTATQASRQFSELLNTIKYTGEHYTIMRGGKPIASLGPAQVSVGDKRLGDLKTLLTKLPKLGEEGKTFWSDLRVAAKKQPGLPKSDAWG